MPSPTTTFRSDRDPAAPPLPLWKRTIDLACCLVALPALVAGTMLIGAVIKLTSPGPIFFRQERVGYKGRRFQCFKFRTMVAGADISAHQAYLAQLMASATPMVKLDAKKDKRLIPGGWIIRASGIDELPQVINILRGEMSVVGPRPCLQYEYDKYEEWQRERFSAVPGLTGLWQVSGKNRTTFDEMIKLDIRYARSKSTWLDLQIILRTVPALLTQIQDTRAGRKGAMTTEIPSVANSAGRQPFGSPRSPAVSAN